MNSNSVMTPFNYLSDLELIELLKGNNQKALSALYFRYWEKLLVVAGNRLNNKEIAEECVQNVFCSLWQRRHDLELKHSLSTYLAVAVKYQVIKQMDKQYRIQEGIDNIVSFQPTHSTADEYLLEKEMMANIQDAITRLPEKCRIVFKMSREDGMSNKQIANELNLSEKTVEAHITKAIRSLRNDLALFPPILFLILS